MLSPSHFSRLLTLLLLLGMAPSAGSGAPEPLRNAVAVLSLTAEQAGERRPVTVTGVVTAAEPEWNGQFFVQDETGGIFVENLRASHPQPGDRVIVSGVTHPGAFAPIISEPQWRFLETGALPPAKNVSIEAVESGTEDGLRIELSGIVRSVVRRGDRLDLALAVGGYRLHVRAPANLTEEPEALVAASVEVRGTAATHYNAAARHLTSVAVYVPHASDLRVIAREVADPFAEPVLPLKRVAEYRRGSGPAQRLHVRGIVTLQRTGQDVFLQDASGGIRVVTEQNVNFTPGEPVDVAGFLEFEQHLPLLRDATLRKSPGTTQPVSPQAVRVADLKHGLHHGELITLRGTILNQAQRPGARPDVTGVQTVTTLLVQGDDLGFSVEIEDHPGRSQLAPIPAGSTVEVSGVAFSEIDEGGNLKSLKLLAASPAALTVIARPSWFTPGRLLVGVGILSVVLVVVVLWLVTIARKNRALGRAQQELQEAHDTLEEKVEERSAQLQLALTARKTEEVQFKAVLTERTRLARDLHDSLEQTLTGIALQLDTAAKLFLRTPQASAHHLQLARNWLRQSQEELRRSIWDLRSRELQRFDLANALRQSAERLVDGTDVTVSFSAYGEKRVLPEVIEENVLRIGQEALTNIAKHARARRIDLGLTFTARALQLRIADDGIGFEPPTNSPTGNETHFGLIGMAERAKRLGGQLTIRSRPGDGTVLEVEIPLPSPVAAGSEAVPVHD